MGKYLTPLWIFIGGNVALLVAWVLLPAVDTASSTLITETANISGTFWNLDWAFSNTKFLVFLVMEMAVLYSTAKAFLTVK